MRTIRLDRLLSFPVAVVTAARSAVRMTPAPQVGEMLDRQQITMLIDRLGRSLDEDRLDDLRSIYTPDATATTPGGTAEGRESLIAQARRTHTRDRHIQHAVSNVLIDLHGDSAEVRANLIATFAPAVADETIPQPQYILGEIYRFDAVRTPDGWRLSQVQSTPIWAIGTRL
ncbi:nuclear transport factor 2 family protein [Nocardia sp. CNY236]|uniref:nuclear transport factor 2 family protein n=1 Tax=Nocardia sp. CNY236 TaxID=1169152 RepID=UPI00041F725B|nr:nuclear transport factor 2 family protein [Nocardia sp. CNY236]